MKWSRKYTVVVFTYNIGVRQWESLSPFHFAMYLNDLEEVLDLNGVNGINDGLIYCYMQVISSYSRISMA